MLFTHVGLVESINKAFESYIDSFVSEDKCFCIVRYLKSKRIECRRRYEYISESHKIKAVR